MQRIMAQQSPCQAYLQHNPHTSGSAHLYMQQQAHAQPAYLANVASLSSIASYTSSLRWKSPGLLGRMCTCTCGTDCPASAPSCQHGGKNSHIMHPAIKQHASALISVRWLHSRHGPVWPKSVRRLQSAAAQRCPPSLPASCQQRRRMMMHCRQLVCVTASMCDSLNSLDWWPRLTRDLQPPHLTDAHIGAPHACC